jgi:hypothetical protein
MKTIEEVIAFLEAEKIEKAEEICYSGEIDYLQYLIDQIKGLPCSS